MSYQKHPKLGIVAALYVLFIMSWLSLVLLFFPLGFYIDITQTISSGAVSNSSGFAFNMIQSVLVFLIPTFFIPWLRNMYRYFPWLLPFVVICTLNLIIFGVGSVHRIGLVGIPTSLMRRWTASLRSPLTAPA